MELIISGTAERKRNNVEQINYYVIGGQYESCCYGGTATLREAKKLAAECQEYWDNWQGYHTPLIFHAADTEETASSGRITTSDGRLIRIPIYGAEPVIWC